MASKCSSIASSAWRFHRFLILSRGSPTSSSALSKLIVPSSQGSSLWWLQVQAKTIPPVARLRRPLQPGFQRVFNLVSNPSGRHRRSEVTFEHHITFGRNLKPAISLCPSRQMECGSPFEPRSLVARLPVVRHDSLIKGIEDLRCEALDRFKEVLSSIPGSNKALVLLRYESPTEDYLLIPLHLCAGCANSANLRDFLLSQPMMRYQTSQRLRAVSGS